MRTRLIDNIYNEKEIDDMEKCKSKFNEERRKQGIKKNFEASLKQNLSYHE